MVLTNVLTFAMTCCQDSCMNKADARYWTKRIREDARLLNLAISAGDEVAISECALDAVGAAMKLVEAFDKAGEV